eukprot:gb/GECG01015209.1/.p1 GENE.gb/GECG01015209.1/~~gb/GECG01015209.1/.p1  ORF type:complete len:366 (+),score=35.39 gb/GECG01015209.1/:1-1098(+)
MFKFDFNLEGGKQESQADSQPPALTETDHREGSATASNPFNGHSVESSEQEQGHQIEPSSKSQGTVWRSETLLPRLEKTYSGQDPRKHLKLHYLRTLQTSERNLLYQVVPLSADIESNSTLKGILANSDVAPGIYEGGFKIWECTFDLLDFLDEFFSKHGVTKTGDFSETHKLLHESPHFLELGCGAGLPGCVALLYGLNVTFQDLNLEVLDKLTLPTIDSNCGYLGVRNSTLVSGDWEDTARLLSTGASTPKYSIIVASETLYNERYYPRLWNVVKDLLRKGGICILASKRFYFGVGGGTTSFVDFIKRQEGLIDPKDSNNPDSGDLIAVSHVDESHSEWDVIQGPIFEDGMSNLREILILRRT